MMNNLPNERAFPLKPWIIVGFVLLAFSLSFPIKTYRLRIFTGDESTYVGIAWSLAYDGDLVYEERDLHRFFKDFPSGPQGIFLKKGKHDRLYYAKSYIYPLLALPFVHIADLKGLFLFNLFLLWIAWGTGIWILRKHDWHEREAYLWGTLFFIASVLIAYVYWFTSEIFNFVMMFLALIFIFGVQESVKKGWLYHIAGIFCASLATFSKPPNIVFFLIAGLYWFFRRDWKRLISGALLSLLIIAGLFFAYWAITGDWNFQGGLRKTFYGHFPYETERATFDALGVWKSSDITWKQELYFDARTLFLDIFYYFFGRYSGMTWYFPLALLVLFTGRGLREGIRIYLLGGFALTALFFILTQPNNYLGGGGTLGNRYFTSVYPWFFLLAHRIPDMRKLTACLIVFALFGLSVVAAPLMSARFPWMYGLTPWHEYLPFEYTLLENLPSNTNPRAISVGFPDEKNPRFNVFFINPAYYGRERKGFWIKGQSKLFFVIKSQKPLKKLTFRFRNGSLPEQTVRVFVDGERHEIHVKRYGVKTLSIHPRGMRVRNVWMLPVKIQTMKGFLPSFYEKRNRDRRYLGIYTELEGE